MTRGLYRALNRGQKLLVRPVLQPQLSHLRSVSLRWAADASIQPRQACGPPIRHASGCGTACSCPSWTEQRVGAVWHPSAHDHRGKQQHRLPCSSHLHSAGSTAQLWASLAVCCRGSRLPGAQSHPASPRKAKMITLAAGVALGRFALHPPGVHTTRALQACYLACSGEPAAGYCRPQHTACGGLLAHSSPEGDLDAAARSWHQAGHAQKSRRQPANLCRC